MQVSPYLSFNGQCEVAFQFYEQCLGGKIVTMLAHAGTPMEGQVPPDWRHKILHASLAVGNTVLMGADAPPDHARTIHGFCVQLALDNPVDAERIFDALAENGKVHLPL